MPTASFIMPLRPSRSSGKTMAGRRGFTLVELLVAVMILAMVLTTLYAAYTGTFRTALATEEDDALHGMARGMFLRLIRDLGGLVPHNGAMVFIAQPAEEGGGFLRLAFRSSAHLAFSPEDVAGGAAFIVYEVRPDKKNEGVFDLLRGDGFPEEKVSNAAGDLSLSGKEAEAARSTFALCTDVHALTYTFYDDEGKEYETWDSVNGPEIQRKRAPAMIQVTLDLAGPSRREAPLRFQTRINLPITKVSADGPF